jgi:hypothetical protein
MGLRSFGHGLQVLAIEHQRYREVRAEGEEDSKRRMYALEKRHAAGEELHPIELCFLLNMQDKYDRKPAVPDPEMRPPTLEQLIDEAREKGELKSGKMTPPPTWSDRLVHYTIGVFSGGALTVAIAFMDKLPKKDALVGINLLFALAFAVAVWLIPEEKDAES